MKPDQPIQCLCTQLKKTARMIGRCYDQDLEPLGINITQYSILINILRYQPIAQIELADHLGMERTTLYRALAVLQKHDLLQLHRRSQGVIKEATLTPKGEELTRQAQSIWRQRQDQIQQQFGPQFMDQLAQTLEQIGNYARI